MPTELLHVILALFFLVIAILAFRPLRRLTTKWANKLNPPAINPQFNGHRTRIDKDTGQITLCSIGYPDPDGNVWIVSHSSLTIIDKRSNKSIPFHKINFMELREMSNGGALQAFSTELRPYVSGELHSSRPVKISVGMIGFIKSDLSVAQAICDRVSAATAV